MRVVLTFAYVGTSLSSPADFSKLANYRRDILKFADETDERGPGAASSRWSDFEAWIRAERSPFGAISQPSSPSNTAARIPRRSRSVRNGSGATKLASPPTPARSTDPEATQTAARAATAPAATAGRSMAP